MEVIGAVLHGTAVLRSTGSSVRVVAATDPIPSPALKRWHLATVCTGYLKVVSVDVEARGGELTMSAVSASYLYVASSFALAERSGRTEVGVAYRPVAGKGVWRRSLIQHRP